MFERLIRGMVRIFMPAHHLKLKPIRKKKGAEERRIKKQQGSTGMKVGDKEVQISLLG